MSVKLLPDILENGPGTGDDEYIVIVFDNDHNTFEQVETILIVATGCSVREAKMETWEVHNLGKSTVHHGAQSECERVAEVIRTIGIKVEVRSDSTSPP